jgi:tRNA A-37 threonylcarbamoyl transferase component Bud32
MSAPAQVLAQLSAAERAELEALLIEFDSQWDVEQLAARVRVMPVHGTLRPVALTEMAKIDLERRWQHGQRVGVEYYLELVPELGSAADALIELVEAEVRVRTQFGTPPTEAELSSRFPALGDRVHQLLRTDPGRQTYALTPAPGADRSTFPNAIGTPRQLSGEFGRYRIRRVIGGGGMGTVYLADDTQLDRAVALKVPHTFRTEDVTARERFRREGRAAAALDHPNLCRVYDVGEQDGVPYLTMAFIEGSPLSTPPGGEPSVERIATLVRKVALALAHAHAHGVVHRDLKPSNILIDARGEPVVTDFGLARREGADDVQVTRDGVPLGTPAYMSPEQVTARARAIGPPTDIFSLGVILYQLLTGQIPYRGGPAEVMVQIAVEPPPRPSEARPGIDPRLEAVCLKALAKAPEDRYASMNEFAAALGAEPPPVRTPGRRRALALGAALFSVAAAVLVIQCNRAERDPKNPNGELGGTPDGGAGAGPQKGETGGPATGGAGAQPEIAPLPRPGGVPPVILPGSRAVTAVAFAPGGAVLSGDENGAHVWDVQTGKEQGTGTSQRRLGVTFSPDGRRYVDHFGLSLELHTASAPKALLQTLEGGTHTGAKAFAANGTRVVVASMGTFGESAALVWDLDANKIHRFKKHVNSELIAAVALSADGKRGASASKDGVRVWEVESGDELRHWPNLPVTALAFTPDGKRVLTGSVLGALVLRDLATGEEVGRFEGHTGAITAVTFSTNGKYLLSASADGTARLWALSTREELQCLDGHTGSVLSAALSSDGKRAVTGGEDGTVRVWTLRVNP